MTDTNDLSLKIAHIQGQLIGIHAILRELLTTVSADDRDRLMKSFSDTVEKVTKDFSKTEPSTAAMLEGLNQYAALCNSDFSDTP